MRGIKRMNTPEEFREAEYLVGSMGYSLTELDSIFEWEKKFLIDRAGELKIPKMIEFLEWLAG